MTEKLKYPFATFLILLGVLLPLHLLSATPLLPPLNKTNSGEQLTGKFIWFDLATVDLKKQKEFYGEVFGWTFQQLNQTDMQYTIIKDGEHNIAGMFQIKPPEGAKTGALWISLMSVPDPDKAVEVVKNAGGSVHTPVTTLADRGTYALLNDPEGALFGVLKSGSGDPPDNDIQTGEILWVDLFAKDMQRAASFYQQVAGYEIIDNEKGRVHIFLHSAGKLRAGIVPRPEEANHSGWLPYVKVNDVVSTLNKVTAAGGHVLVQPDKTLLNGNLAIFTDPEGGIIGIVKWDQP